MADPTRGDLDAATAAATAGIGARLARLRDARRMRVSELARQAGVSPSLISQIERGGSKPSVGTLFAIAQVLGVPVDVFFSETDPDAMLATEPAPQAGAATAEPPADHGVLSQAATDGPGASMPWRDETSASREVVRRENRSTLDIRGGVRWERLTPTPLDGIEFLELVYSPGAESDRQAYRHPGVELVLATQGVMTIFLGFERHDLHPGDSIAFPSSTPHRYVNLTDGETRAITVILRDDLSRLQIREHHEGTDAFAERLPNGETTSA
jgi:transcriptional regulator with XRE-family HTH domain/quercetin dioxygenase-like cupin family protein